MPAVPRREVPAVSRRQVVAVPWRGMVEARRPTLQPPFFPALPPRLRWCQVCGFENYVATPTSGPEHPACLNGLHPAQLHALGYVAYRGGWW